MHTFLRDLKKGQFVDCVYLIDYRSSDIERQLKDSTVYERQIASNGNRYIVLRIKDCSLVNFESAQVYFYYNNESDFAFLRDGSSGKSAYIKIKGKAFSEYPNVRLGANQIIPTNTDPSITFDTSDLYPYNDYFRDQFLSPSGKVNVPLRHTSSQAFQEDYDLIDIGAKLHYQRVFDSAYDRSQINVFIDDMDESFTIPAYLSPTMAKMIDDGYAFDITVTDVTPRDEEKGFNAGIRVCIRGIKQ